MALAVPWKPFSAGCPAVPRTVQSEPESSRLPPRPRREGHRDPQAPVAAVRLASSYSQAKPSSFSNAHSASNGLFAFDYRFSWLLAGGFDPPALVAARSASSAHPWAGRTSRVGSESCTSQKCVPDGCSQCRCSAQLLRSSISRGVPGVYPRPPGVLAGQACNISASLPECETLARR